MEIAMFRHITHASTLQDAKISYTAMSTDVKRLFPQIFTLMKLLFVCPVSSCESERSFSALRRLKTWLRSTLGQKRLNYVAVCHVHKDLLMKVNVQRIASDFIKQSEIRKNVFGSFKIPLNLNITPCCGETVLINKFSKHNAKVLK